MRPCRPRATVALFLCVFSAGCAELEFRPYRDDELLSGYHYALGEQFIEIDGLTLCYQEFGSGPPIVILPGLGTSIDFWQLNIPALAEHHRVLAVDLPGWGKSDKPDVSYELEWIRERIVRFMDATDVPCATLIGGSMGGHLALLMAIHDPQRVDRLVLVGSVGNWGEVGPLAVAGLHTFWTEPLVGGILRSQWPAIFEKLFVDQTPMTELLFRYQMAVRADPERWYPEGRACTRALRSIILTSCRSRLPNLQTPTLLIWGQEDTIHPPVNGMDFRRLLPQSRLVVLPSAAHEVMVDQAEIFNELVLKFVDQGLEAVADSYPPELERTR